MHGSAEFSASGPLALPRRVILGLAVAVAVAAAAPTVVAIAQEAPPAAVAVPGKATGAGDNHGIAISIGAKTTPDQAQDGKSGDTAAAPAKGGQDTGGGKRIITVTKDGKTVTLTGFPDDREFDSLGDFVHTEPALAIMVIAIVALVFLSPVFAIALILNYRMRKTRIQNETMLKLAERGVVAPAEAIEAITAGTMRLTTDAATRSGGNAPAPIERAKELRKRAAWSDLRKGTVMGAIGLGLTLHSLFTSRSSNGIGLVLLLVGVGYIVLWWFEERQITPRNGDTGNRPGGGPGGGV